MSYLQRTINLLTGLRGLCLHEQKARFLMTRFIFPQSEILNIETVIILKLMACALA